MLSYDNIKYLVKQYYGEDSIEYQTIINKTNNFDTFFFISEINNYIEEIKKYSKISIKERQKYIDEYLNGDMAAKQNLINSYLFYVFLIALTYVGNGINLEDLIQEANMGLITAINILNDSNKNQCQALINNYVKRSISEFINEYNDSIESKRNINFKRLHKIIRQHNSLNRQIIEEICNELNMEYTELLELFNKNISLNLNIEDNYELESIIPDNTYNPDSFINIQKKDNSKLLSIINDSNLTENQKKCIIYKFGLLDNVPKTLKETATFFKVSRSHIHTTIKSAIKKLKENKVLANLYNFDDIIDTDNELNKDSKETDIIQNNKNDESETIKNNEEKIVDSKFILAMEKVEIINNAINKISISNELQKCKYKDKDYKLMINYNIHHAKYNKKYYKYHINLIENDKNILNIDFNLNDINDGLRIITSIINNFNENTDILSAKFNNIGDSIITNKSGIKIITSIKNNEEKDKFIILHNSLNLNINSYYLKIKR